MQDSTIPYREIPLTRGKVALVDAEDYERVSALKWQACLSGAKLHAKTWYAFSRIRGGDGKIRQVKLHQFVFGPVRKGFLIDHRNRDGLDCQRSNLRLATRSENRFNSKLDRTNTSGFRGVFKHQKRWRWQIYIDGERFYSDCDTPQEAARKYDELALKYRGKFAVLNFPKE